MESKRSSKQSSKEVMHVCLKIRIIAFNGISVSTKLVRFSVEVLFGTIFKLEYAFSFFFFLADFFCI